MADDKQTSGADAAPRPGAESVNPYGTGRDKGEEVEEMFDTIAPAYDFMNTAMTLGLHRMWRDRALRAASRALAPETPARILDVATGTGDLAFRLHGLLPEARITGIDLSAGMLDVARRRLDAMDPAGRAVMDFAKADCLDLPYADGTYDLVTVAYGVRNFADLLKGLEEMRRVLRPGGVLCVVELSCPANPLARAAYNLYTRTLIPGVGRLVSGDSRAYTYLPESIAACPQRGDMAALMTRAGFGRVTWKPLTFGAVTYYIATNIEKERF